MSVINKKNRMVSFRLSGAEYAAAEKSCTQHGVRSVSSLARDATLRLTGSMNRGPSGANGEILLDLQRQILDLRAELSRFTEKIDRPTSTVEGALISVPRAIPSVDSTIHVSCDS